MEEKIELTHRQRMVISHILASATLEEARRKARLSKGTLYAWLKDDAFNAELNRQRDEVVQVGLTKLKNSVSKAIEGLITFVDSNHPYLKLRACKDIIDYTLKTIEIENIEKRLEKIEQQLTGKAIS